MKNFEIEKHPQEIAEKLYESVKDMDFLDYEEEKEQIITELEDALYHLKTVAQNEHNQEYFRTFYKILEAV